MTIIEAAKLMIADQMKRFSLPGHEGFFVQTHPCHHGVNWFCGDFKQEGALTEHELSSGEWYEIPRESE